MLIVGVQHFLVLFVVAQLKRPGNNSNDNHNNNRNSNINHGQIHSQHYQHCERVDISNNNNGDDCQEQSDWRQQGRQGGQDEQVEKGANRVHQVAGQRPREGVLQAQLLDALETLRDRRGSWLERTTSNINQNKKYITFVVVVVDSVY